MKMNSQHSKFTGYSEGSTEREVHSDTGLPKEDRNISNERLNPMLTRTLGTTTKTAQIKKKEENNKYQSRIK